MQWIDLVQFQQKDHDIKNKNKNKKTNKHDKTGVSLIPSQQNIKAFL